MDTVQNLSIKIDEVSMNPVPNSWSVDPVQRWGLRTPGPCFVPTRSEWLPSHTKFVAEFSFSPFPLCTSIWLPGKFFMGAFSQTGTNDNLYDLRDWSHHFVFVTVQSSSV